MASHHDQNPFSHNDDINHFANHGTSSRLSALEHEPALVYGLGVPAPHNSLDTNAKLKKKLKELEAKEAELNRREEILRRKEEALAKSGNASVIRPKNWPSCYPLVHHDIANDIPLHLQRIQYVAYAILLGVPISLFWNVLLSIAVFASGAAGVFVFFSIIYFLLGPLGAFYFWYRPLYRAFRTNNGTSFGCFFFNFFNHIVFFTFAAIGPRIIFVGLQFAGLLNAMTLISGYPALGIMAFIGFGFFTIEPYQDGYTLSPSVYQTILDVNDSDGWDEEAFFRNRLFPALEPHRIFGIDPYDGITTGHRVKAVIVLAILLISMDLMMIWVAFSVLVEHIGTKLSTFILLFVAFFMLIYTFSLSGPRRRRLESTGASTVLTAIPIGMPIPDSMHRRRVVLTYYGNMWLEFA